MRYFIPTVFLSVLWLLSINVIAQSGKNVRPSLWWQGQLPGSGSTGSLNFNPATLMSDRGSAIKVPEHINSLRRITVFTVYQQPTGEEQPLWQIAGKLGDLSLSTRQVTSQGKSNTLAFVNNAAGQPIIHTYQGRHKVADNGEGNDETFIQFGDSRSNGTIAEFILYERILNEEELTKTETYLALKYGISLEKNYVSSSGHILWNYKNDNYYSHHITGIGRDDRSSLYQKQGTSSYQPGELVIGANTITPSNQLNTGQLGNGDYLIWGDNDQSLTLQETIKAGDEEILLTGKKWMMKRTGATAHTTPTELAIDIKTLFSHYPKENFYLVIDRSGSGNFASGNCTYITPASISPEGIAHFNNVKWDTDGSGKDIFAFALKTNPPVANKNIVSFQVYPNPVINGNYKITVTLDKPTDIQIQVYDLHQRLLETRKGAGQSDYLFSGHLNAPAGAYTVRLVTPDTEMNRIIILQ